MTNFEDKKIRIALIFSNIILFLYLIYRLFDQSKILRYFPLDTTNDISSHIGQLYFLKACGFHNLCSYWYNGFYLLKFYPPGWFFFSYPFLLIFKRPELAAYISIIAMLIISFIAIYKIIKLDNKSWLKTISFFLFLFGTATSVSAFFRLGRVTEMFGWMIFLILMYIILKYKDKKIDINFIYFVPFYTILLIAQPIVAIPSHFFLTGLFLVKLKSKKELLILIISVLLGIIFSSFWWYPFVKDIEEQSRTYDYLPEIIHRFFDIYGQWTSSVILITILPILTLIIFYIYYISKNKDKKELLFYSPIILLSILVLTRITTIIPYLNYVYPEPYFTFFIIFSLLFFFKTNINNLPKLNKIIPFLIVVVVVLSTVASIYETSYYLEHTDLERNTIELLKDVKGKYLILETPSLTSYPKAYYSYGAIYLNISTPSGWSPSELTDEHQKLLKDVGDSFRAKDCINFRDRADKLQLQEVISYNDFCSLKEKCGFKEIIGMDNACLIRI